MPKASLQTQPPELLVDIFSYACNDGGRMGCSLNLVCQTFRQLCLDSGVDIQIALVSGHRQVETFLNVLRGRVESKRKVVSLFISYRGGDGWHETRQETMSTFSFPMSSMVDVMTVLRFQTSKSARAT